VSSILIIELRVRVRWKGLARGDRKEKESRKWCVNSVILILSSDDGILHSDDAILDQPENNAEKKKNQKKKNNSSDKFLTI
jgi:hypothetical protein